MTDTTLIWKAMLQLVPEDHPAVYLYITGHRYSTNSAINRCTETVEPLFRGAFDVSKIRKVSKEYLKMMESEYKGGRLKIKDTLLSKSKIVGVIS